MKPPPLPVLPRRLQRRLSVLLSAALCLWMLASATHFHTWDLEASTHHNTPELCTFCVFVPGAGAAPALAVLVSKTGRQQFLTPADSQPSFATRCAASYRSRAPPFV